MARKEINVFGTSFLDLLSGALAAVIILYVIVPKMTQSERQALDEIEQMNVQVEDMVRQLEALQDMIPQDAYNALVEQVGQMQENLHRLEESVEALQDRNAQLEEENRTLRAEAARADSLQRRVEELEEELQRQQGQQQPSPQNGSDKIFGMDAELGIVCQWEENCDVDLFVKDLASGVECYFNQRQTSFGNLLEDVMSQTAGSSRYELFFQHQLCPGRYLVSVAIYHTSHAPANVSGYVVLHPGQSNEQKIPYDAYLGSVGRRVQIGILIVEPNNITLQR